MFEVVTSGCDRGFLGRVTVMTALSLKSTRLCILPRAHEESMATVKLGMRWRLNEMEWVMLVREMQRTEGDVLRI
jgi:hypothetical protein